MTEDNIPDELQHYLELIGVRVAVVDQVAVVAAVSVVDKAEVERDFTFKMPNFDENGEPDF